MIQPKYKFGDSLIGKDHGKGYPRANLFEVNYIKRTFNSEFMYSKDTEQWHHELDIELYQEPKKRRLYAYDSTSGRVNFYSGDGDIRFNDENGRLWSRAPEYDLEFPDA